MKTPTPARPATTRVSRMMTRRMPLLLALVLLSAPLACQKDDDAADRDIASVTDTGSQGDDDTGDTGIEEPEDAEHSDATDTRGGDEDGSSTPDTDSGGEQGDGGFNPIDTRREDTSGPGVTGSCEEIQDLGELAFGSQQIEFAFNANNDHVRTSCRDLSAPSRPEKVFKFQVSERAVFELNANANTIFELRTDPCGDEESILACNPNGSMLGQNLDAGIDYYLIVEFESDIPDQQNVLFEMNLQSVFTECGPGQTACISSTDANVCNNLGSYEQKTCPTACDGDSCVGDSCANPIEVTSSSTMSGDITAFSSKIRGFTACGQGGGTQRLDGQEIVFLASQLTPGQTINVDASGDSLSNAIVIQRNGCGPAASCEHYGTSGNETVSYSVTRGGDYYIIIDSPSLASGTANYNVSVN